MYHSHVINDDSHVINEKSANNILCFRYLVDYQDKTNRAGMSYPGVIAEYTMAYPALNPKPTPKNPNPKKADPRLKDVQQKAYEFEMVRLTNQWAYAGLWQMYQLANVCKRPVLSIFPGTADATLRYHYNRLIKPIGYDPGMEKMPIMWSKSDPEISRFNHFVAVVL